jgi:hypothetical protein
MTQPGPSDVNPYVPPSGVDHMQAQPGLRRAAMALLICAILGLLGSVYNIAFWTLVLNDSNPIYRPRGDVDQIGWQVIFSSSVMAVQCLLAIAGSIAMLRQRSRGMALASAVAVILPMCGCFLVPTAIGIWCVVVLCSQGAKRAFAGSDASVTSLSKGA